MTQNFRSDEPIPDDWKAQLFTIFVDKLSKRVSRRALWEAFNDYGRVMDIFIPVTANGGRKFTTFAFVRYKTEAKMWNAIKARNNRRIDGLNTIVKRAIFG
ncbi:hypothetical protein DITRI_Ditri17bG0135600 [Diplodiscus trichospermus]